jgi:hypothetical protein
MRTDLLSGTYTAGTFQTALATAANSAAFTELANSYGSAEMLVNSTTAFPVIAGSSTARTIATNAPAFLRACANSGYATEQLVTTADGAELFGIVLRDATGSRFSHWRNFTNNYNLIKSFVNKSGSKLKSQTFTSTGTWTAPASIKAMSIFGVGGGASGVANTTGGDGGGGGEIECLNVPFASLPSANQTVTIGAGGTSGSSGNGANTTVGALFTASGATWGGANPGGGTTANGGYINFTDWEEPFTAAFQCFTASQQGGSSPVGTSGTLGGSGGDGLPGSGGNPSYDSVSATGGRAYGGAGGSAGQTSNTSGGNASANTGGGGGATDGAGTYGGNGGSGIAVIYWLEG